MKILHMFILCLITVRTLTIRTLTANTGGGINIKCRYEDKHKDKTKCFCKMGTQQECLDQINTEAHKEWTHKGRFSIQDTRSAGFFSVLIRELTVKDTATYRCAVVASDQTLNSTTVNLNVVEDLSYEKATSKTVLIGENVTISCSYPNSHRSDPKFFCKMLHSGVCTYKTSVKESRTAVREEKISLNDDRAKKVFTVSIMHVNERDSGEYWCGVEAGESEDGYKVYIMRIDMTVTDPNVRVSQRPSSLSSSSTSTHRIPTNSSKSSTSHPVPTSLLTGSPVFITVSVILAVLLVLLIAFFTGIFWRRMDPILTVPRTIHEVPSADIRRLSNTLYSTDHLPTIPADSSHAVYANIGLPTIPTDTVYATTQLPSDGPDQYVCSTT